MKRRRVPSELVVRDSDIVKQYLRDGRYPSEGDAFLELLGVPTEALAVAWKALRRELLPAWIAAAPGTRPWGWWQFEAPEPRRRLGGTGDVFSAGKLQWGLETDWTSAEQVELYTGCLRHVDGHLLTEFAVPGFDKVAVDPRDPPRHESQAAYLSRLGLLTAKERRRIPAAAFEPDVLCLDAVTAGSVPDMSGTRSRPRDHRPGVNEGGRDTVIH